MLSYCSETLMARLFPPHPGGPFDLMSRRLIVASSRKIAERIAREIKEFEVGRDDAGGQ